MTIGDGTIELLTLHNSGVDSAVFGRDERIKIVQMAPYGRV